MVCSFPPTSLLITTLLPLHLWRLMLLQNITLSMRSATVTHHQIPSIISLKQSKINAHQLTKQEIDHLSYLQPMIYEDKTPHLKINMIDQYQ